MKIYKTPPQRRKRKDDETEKEELNHHQHIANDIHNQKNSVSNAHCVSDYYCEIREVEMYHIGFV